MKKALLIVSAVALIAWGAVALAGWVFSLFWSDEAVAASTARPWPGGMGTLDSVMNRFPPLEANDAARKLTTLASALPRDRAVEDFVAREVARGEPAIGEPPVIADISAIRDLLLREQIVWPRREGIGGGDDTQTRRALQMTMARALVASALAKARANDSAAWDDLHAVWKLARTLDAYPQMLSQTAAFSMVRMVNAVAWKMPLPVPAWLGELQQRDSVRPLLESFQYQTARYYDESFPFPTKVLAASVDRDRTIAEDLVNETRCDVNARVNEVGVDLTGIWRRAFRYRAEREATANALRVREDKPIETSSRCSDGAWTFNGTTLRFNRDIATAPPDRPMPLVLRIK